MEGGRLENMGCGRERGKEHWLGSSMRNGLGDNNSQMRRSGQTSNSLGRVCCAAGNPISQSHSEVRWTVQESGWVRGKAVCPRAGFGEAWDQQPQAASR